MRAYNYFLVFILLSFSTMIFSAEYTMDEISKHNTPESCWIVIEKNVYDVSKYIEKHPAPKVVMKKSCGKDVTQDYKTKKGMDEAHSQKAQDQRETMKIGTLK